LRAALRTWLGLGLPGIIRSSPHFFSRPALASLIGLHRGASGLKQYQKYCCKTILKFLAFLPSFATILVPGLFLILFDTILKRYRISGRKSPGGLGRCPKNLQGASPLTHFRALPEPILAGGQEKKQLLLF